MRHYVVVEDMGYRPEGHMLKRIDKKKPYEPDNCKYVPTTRGKNGELR